MLERLMGAPPQGGAGFGPAPEKARASCGMGRIPGFRAFPNPRAFAPSAKRAAIPGRPRWGVLLLAVGCLLAGQGWGQTTKLVPFDLVASNESATGFTVSWSVAPDGPQPDRPSSETFTVLGYHAQVEPALSGGFPDLCTDKSTYKEPG